jgi:hypothetical protein
LDERSSGCGVSTVGSGFPLVMDVGRGVVCGCAGGGGGAGDASASGVIDRSVEGVAAFLFFADWSLRAAARAGSLRFLSRSMSAALMCPLLLMQALHMMTKTHFL